MATGELASNGPGSAGAQGTGLQDVGDVLGAEGLEGEPVGDGTGHDIGGIDLGQNRGSCGRGGGR